MRTMSDDHVSREEFNQVRADATVGLKSLIDMSKQYDFLQVVVMFSSLCSLTALGLAIYAVFFK